MLSIRLCTKRNYVVCSSQDGESMLKHNYVHSQKDNLDL